MEGVHVAHAEIQNVPTLYRRVTINRNLSGESLETVVLNWYM